MLFVRSFVQLFLVCELCAIFSCVCYRKIQHNFICSTRVLPLDDNRHGRQRQQRRRWSRVKKLFVQIEGRVACAWSRWLHQWPNETKKKKQFQLVFAWQGIVCKSAWKVLLNNSQALIVLVFIPSLFSHFSFPFFFFFLVLVCSQGINQVYCEIYFVEARTWNEQQL